MSIIFGETKSLKISDLLLDPENPRIPEPDDGKPRSQAELARILDMGFDAFTVAESLAVHGYFASEPMIAISGTNGKWIVVEGNRRLTAILGLTDAGIRGGFLEAKKWDEIATNSKITSNDSIPVVIASSRLDAAPIIGTKHIGGILQWKPYPQARYIANLVDVHKIAFADVATLLGLKKNLVIDLYREQAISNQAKSLGINTGNVESAFSLLTVAMRNSKLREHVGAPVGTAVKQGEDPIPAEKFEEIKEILTFIFGDENTEAIITDSRQITTLANVVANPEGLKALRAGKSLDEAKQKITVSGQTPLERLVNRLTAGKNALVAAADDISESYGEEVVKTLLTEIEDALGTLKTVAEDDA
jgi:hypothetical protein